ncbi:fibro-slime domain-containing protein [Ruminococcus difficilis]|uniref:Fibro-slime domain-containing protein n=1 Tax=Ruminococcus difficilis TaxID=2763069 RepID=A0A934TYV9_9FIRM|nr:fibro-slime domain-containing protein [Ruminococcus difficilis]MBK6087123.1 fibro-slime domain-containing protein [Ruminococcus difficilis]
MKQKTNRLHFSTRTIAMILSVIMLIGSIATGSMLSTFAAYLKDNVNSDAVSQAASEGCDIAKSAIPSQDADAANITDNNDAKDTPDLSGFEENEIVRGMKDDLAGTGADADVSQTGADTHYLFFATTDNPSNWSNYVTSTNDTFTFTASQVGLTGGFKTGTNYFIGISSSSSVTNMWSQGGNATVSTSGTAFSSSGKQNNNPYNFARFSLGTAVDSITVAVTHSNGTTNYALSAAIADNNWYLVEGPSWTAAVSSAVFTYNNATGYYEKTVSWTGDNYFRVSQGTTQYSGNNSTSEDYTLSADTSVSLVKNSTKSFKFTAGSSSKEYTIQIDNGSKKIRIKEVSTYTFSLPTVEHAVVKATYNGTTINEGGTLTDLPSNASITINVTPDSLYTCDNMSCTVTGSVIAPTGPATKYTFTMPAVNVPATAISFTLTDQSGNMRTVYFNNYYTRYENVFAYAKTSTGLEPLGPWAGTGMTKLANTNTYSIEVPYAVDKIFFIGYINPASYSTGELTIPWDTYNNKPKYTPINASDPTTTTGGGTWGEYVARTNEYTVSDGDTIKNNPNIYTGITATFYDYYVDSEVDGEWITDISDDNPKDYTNGSNADQSTTKWNPYKELNHALSEYAHDFSVDKPLYFGNLNTNNGGGAVITDKYNNGYPNNYYWNFNLNTNNSINLHPASTAITGLAGSTMTNSTIHYAGTNGAEMAMFDEDFLSGENDKGKVLATILRSPSFPVRKEENVGQTVSSITKLHLDPTGGTWTNDNAVFDAYFWGANLSGTWREFSGSGTDYVADIPNGAEKVIITRNNTHGSGFSVWSQSEDISLTLSGSSAVNKVKFTGWTGGNPDKGKFNTSLDTSLSGCTLTEGHTYYEYDSTGGKDNAYITNIDRTENKHTANIDYYANDAAWSGGTTENKQGFFPFDYANKGGLAKDLGFGMKLEIPFTLNENGLNKDGSAQTFDFSGDDDLWVFVDDKLVLDLGGAHGRTTGSINFNTKQASMDTAAAISSVATSTNVTGAAMTSNFNWFNNTNPNTIHTMTIYYMERGMFDSNLKFGFSFHAIPNLLRTEKKVRTNGANGSTRINSGFFTANTDRNNIGESGKTLFEESFNQDKFSFIQEYSTNGGASYSTAEGKVYTIGSESTNNTVGTAGKYDMVNDRVVNFLGEFDNGNYIRLTETPQTTDYYTYDQKLLLFDDAVSTTEPLAEDTYITKTSDGAVDHYAFQFSESAPSSSALDNLRLRARFENMMRAHTLTLRKAITGTDDTEQFTIKVLFKFPGSNNYIVYPAFYKKVDKNGDEINGNLNPSTGAVTLAANEYIELSGIPENTEIKVVEDLSGNTSYNYIRTTVLDEDSDTVLTEDLTGNEKGVTFMMGDKDQTATVNNSKQLILTHTLHPNNLSDDGTKASTYVKYEILNSNDQPQYTSDEVKNGPLTVNGTYLVSDSSNKLRVTLRTPLADFYNFKEYTVQDGVTETASGENYYMIDGSEGHRGLYSSQSTKTHSSDHKEYTLVNTYSINQLFTNGKLKTNELDYFSEVEKPEFKYQITYNYPAYVKTYGNQSYTYTGTFTDYELEKYMEYSSLILDRKDKSSGSETESFFKTLVNNNAPYEKNFRTEYDFSTAAISHLGSTASSGLYEMSVTVDANPTKVNATFVMPYALSPSTYCTPVVDGNNKVNKASSGDTTSMTFTVYSHDWVNITGKRNPKDTSTDVEPTFIKPALIYYDGEQAYYFQYWSVKTESSYKSAAKEYTRCYDASFNLTVFQNCTIEPVYSTTRWSESDMPSGPSSWDNYERFDPDVMRNKDTMGKVTPVIENLSNEITVAFIENSRNQYNHNGGGTIDNSRKGAGDRIYSDFLLSYNNIAGNQQLNLLDFGTKKVGLVIQPVGTVDPTEGTQTEAEYATQYGAYVSSADFDAIKEYLSNNGSTSGYQFATAQFDARELDNKNRIQYYFGLNNKSFVAYNATTLPELASTYSNNHFKVFRAYAYIVDCTSGNPDWTTLKVNNEATYFTIYDIGSIQNGQKN